MVTGMRRLGFLFAVAALTSGAARPTTVKDLAFLTRVDCPLSIDMAMNTEKALAALGWPHDYQVIDLGTLQDTDARTGYPTPTVLWKGKDIFGMAAPKPPYNGPT